MLYSHHVQSHSEDVISSNWNSPPCYLRCPNYWVVIVVVDVSCNVVHLHIIGLTRLHTHEDHMLRTQMMMMMMIMTTNTDGWVGVCVLTYIHS